MPGGDLAARLLRTFLDELDEQVRELNAELLALERDGTTDPARLGAIFRVAHTLKGAARATRLTPIEELCHVMESTLSDARDGYRTLGPGEFRLLYGAADALSGAGAQLRSGTPLDSAPLARLTRQFAGGGVPGELPAAPATATPAPSAAVTPDAAPDAAGVSVRDSDPLEEAPRAANRRGAHGHDGHDAGGASADDGADAPHDSIAVRSETQVRVQSEKLADLLATAGEMMLAAGAITEVPDAVSTVATSAARAITVYRRASIRLRQTIERGGGGVAERQLLLDLGDALRTVLNEAQRAALHGERAAGLVHRASGELMESVRRLRLRPFAEAVEALPRVVRDLASETGKQVELQIVGADVEADRSVLDGLRDALLQLVRNAVDHGIETPAERLRAGKSADGTIIVAAALRGQELHVTVSDDGGGVDLDGIRARARARGFVVPTQERALARLLFESGFSTRASATEISGRGVGLDIVRAAAERLRGTVDVRWRSGRGTTFVIETPLTLATQRALLVDVSGQTVAIPTASVTRLRRVAAADLREVDGRLVLPDPEGALPLASLAALLGPPLVAPDFGEGELVLVVLESDEQRVALVVDALVTESDLVVRPIERRGSAPFAHLGGAALLPSGRIALVANPNALAVAAVGERGAAPARRQAAAAARTPRILVVDDSITTRTLEQSVLTAAGYDVITAVDGQAGWELVQEHAPELVLTDVEMPRMDGYALCETIRASSRFARLPVVLVTSLESVEQQRRGMDAGADAYIVKSSFDQEELLQTVRQLLGRGNEP